MASHSILRGRRPHELRPFSAFNASIGQPGWEQGLDEAVALGFDRVELWWPFSQQRPQPGEIDALVAELKHHGLMLVALNLWGGCLDLGERGVLHTRSLSEEHLIVVEQIHQALARAGGAEPVCRFNMLLGRSGTALGEEQITRAAATADSIARRISGRLLIEPLSGMNDYPVTDVLAAAEAARRIDDARDAAVAAAHPTAVLLDFYHVCANGLSLSDIADQVAEARERGVEIGHAQWADVPGRGAPGTGNLDPVECLELLRGFGYRGEFVAEYL